MCCNSARDENTDDFPKAFTWIYFLVFFSIALFVHLDWTKCGEKVAYIGWINAISCLPLFVLPFFDVTKIRSEIGKKLVVASYSVSLLAIAYLWDEGLQNIFLRYVFSENETCSYANEHFGGVGTRMLEKYLPIASFFSKALIGFVLALTPNKILKPFKNVFSP